MRGHRSSQAPETASKLTGYLTRVSNHGLLQKSFFSLLIKLSAMFLGFFVAMILARQLGPGGYGVYAFVLSLIALLAVPAQLGLPTLVLRETAKYRADADWDGLKSLWRWSSLIVLGLSSGIAMLVFMVAQLLPGQIDSTLRTTLFFGLILAPLVALGGLRAAALRGLGWVNAGQLPEAVLRPGIFVVLLLVLAETPGLERLSPGLAMALHAVSAAIAFVVGAMILLRARPFTLTARKKRVYETRNWISSALSLSLVSGMMLINQNTDIIMLGVFRPTEEVGLYRVAISSASLVAFGLNAVTMVAAPEFARLHRVGDTARLARVARHTAQLIFMLALPIALFFVFFGADFLGFAFGEEFRQAHLSLAILSLGQLVNGAFGSVGALLNMTGHERATARGVAWAAAINILLNCLLIPPFGLTGAAVATAIAMAVWNLLLWRSVAKKLGVSSLAFGKILQG